MSYFSRAATTIWHWTCWFGVMLFLVFASLLVMPGLAVWFSLDFLPKRRSKPLTFQAPNRRLLPIPVHKGGDIYAVMPDDTEVLLEPLQAARQAQMWNEVVSGAWCHEKTRLRGDTEDAAPHR